MSEKLILKAQLQTEVYISDGGFLVLEQKESSGYVNSIILSPSQSKNIASFISIQSDFMTTLWDADEVSD